VKQHKTLRSTPVMAAGLTKRFMCIGDIVKLVSEKKHGKSCSHKKKKTAA